jgi:hypothetical protein
MSKPTFALTFVCSLLAMSLPACDGGDKAKPEAHAEAKEAGGHAKAGAKPGSYEDWCGEHQVPESMCTRCNPELEAAFKATGDWCPEHKMPESQCLACNPDLKIERPPKEPAGE